MEVNTNRQVLSSRRHGLDRGEVRTRGEITFRTCKDCLAACVYEEIAY